MVQDLEIDINAQFKVEGNQCIDNDLIRAATNIKQQNQQLNVKDQSKKVVFIPFLYFRSSF